MRSRALAPCSLVLVALVASMAGASDAALPAALVGEWVALDSDFADGALTRGTVLYLRGDGLGVWVTSPPPLGVPGHATWDEGARRLTVRVTRPGRQLAVCSLAWDAASATLVDEGGDCGHAPFTRRRDHVPDYVLEAVEPVD